VVGNQVFEKSEMAVLQAISRMTSDFLGIDTPVAAALRASRKIHDSVQARRPYLLETTTDESAAALKDLARALMQADVASLREARERVEGREITADHPLEEPLPAPLGRYQRAHERFPVRCRATLIFAAGTLSVGMLDVSEGGARLSIERPPAPGARAVLILGAMPERPSVPCVIRRSSAEGHEAGVEFLADRVLMQRIVTDLVRRFAVPEAAPPAVSAVAAPP
jgi:hypothetical protein